MHGFGPRDVGRDKRRLGDTNGFSRAVLEIAR